MPWYCNNYGDRLWYEDQGEGPVIVLIHGWSMSSAVWSHQLASLSDSFRVIAPDLAGHGRSAQSAGGYGFEGFAADIAALYRHLGLTGTMLAGWSLGAQVALQLYATVRDQLEGLVLIAATPCFIATDDFPTALSPIEAEGMVVKLRRNSARAREGFISRMFAPDEMDDPALSALILNQLAAIPIPEKNVSLDSLRSLVSADMRHLLAGIDLPTLVINGDRDVICLPGASAFMTQRIAYSRHVEMQGCGHAPFLTRADEFERCLTDFSRRIRDCGR